MSSRVYTTPLQGERVFDDRYSQQPRGTRKILLCKVTRTDFYVTATCVGGACRCALAESVGRARSIEFGVGARHEPIERNFGPRTFRYYVVTRGSYNCKSLFYRRIKRCCGLRFKRRTPERVGCLLRYQVNYESR